MEGTWVDHAHVKLFPMHDTKHMKEWTWKPMEAHWTERFEQYPWYLTTIEGERTDDELLKKLAEGIMKKSQSVS